jgi:DNA-binding transcriptional LysR family regulator
MRLEILTDDGLTDIVRSGFDAGIRLEEYLEKDMIGVPVGEAQRFVVVGAPSYFAKLGVPSTPRSLKDHRCIGRRFPSGRMYHWDFERLGDPPLPQGQE